MNQKKGLYEDNLSDVFFWSNPIPMWIYAKSGKQILEVNDSAVDAYGYSRLEFNHLFHDDFIGENIPADFPGESESELLKQLSIHRASDGSSFVTLMVECPIIYKNKEAMLARSIKVFN
ncbi:hypothetical protein [Fodinibius sp. SL11]|uniref:hypothetical protein n=1 Tax=Fodinibius sp. SL11 TaxID=3425690 RepID=UPI003F88515F